MFTASVITKGDWVQVTPGEIERLPHVMRAFTVQRVVPRVTREVDQRLKRAPRKPSGKRRWTSERQRRYVFAHILVDRYGRFKPYRRTGRIIRGWEVQVERREESMSIRAVNEVPGVEFVQGQWQQLFHRDTGWQYAPSVIAQIGQIAADLYERDFWTYYEAGPTVRRMR